MDDASARPDLTTFDVIVINTSGGKDSQAILDYVTELATEAGVRDRIVAVHCDLGRVEWKGTKELAEAQVAHYGHRFEAVSRDRDLLHQIEFERGKFPDRARRFCTSDQKTSQVMVLHTRLARDLREGGYDVVDGKIIRRPGLYRPIRILDCLGMRAQESPERAKKAMFGLKAKKSSGNKHVYEWLPIHQWRTEDVWARIKASGVPHHFAYDLGMPRLSCCFCVFSTRSALTLAAQHNPELAAEYVAIEARIGHKFHPNFTIAEIVEAAATTSAAAVGEWAA